MWIEQGSGIWKQKSERQTFLERISRLHHGAHSLVQPDSHGKRERVWSTVHIGLVLTPTPTGVGNKYVRTTAFTSLQGVKQLPRTRACLSAHPRANELHMIINMETAINANSCTNNPLPSLAVFCDTHSALHSTALVRMQCGLDALQ